MTWIALRIIADSPGKTRRQKPTLMKMIPFKGKNVNEKGVQVSLFSVSRSQSSVLQMRPHPLPRQFLTRKSGNRDQDKRTGRRHAIQDYNARSTRNWVTSREEFSKKEKKLRKKTMLSSQSCLFKASLSLTIGIVCPFLCSTSCHTKGYSRDIKVGVSVDRVVIS